MHNDTSSESVSRSRAGTTTTIDTYMREKTVWPYAVHTHIQIQVSRTWNCVSVKQVQIEPCIAKSLTNNRIQHTNTYARCSGNPFFNYFIYNKKTISHEFNNGAIQAQRTNWMNWMEWNGMNAVSLANSPAALPLPISRSLFRSDSCGYFVYGLRLMNRLFDNKTFEENKIAQPKWMNDLWN